MEESPCWYFSWWRMSTVLATGGLAPSSCVGKTLSSGGEIFGNYFASVRGAQMYSLTG